MFPSLPSHTRVKTQLTIQPAKIRGYRLSLNSRKLTSNYDPIKEAKNILSDYQTKLLEAPPETVVVCIGFFPIYHLIGIRGLIPKLKVVVFEDSPISLKEMNTVWNLIVEDPPTLSLLNGLCENLPLDEAKKNEIKNFNALDIHTSAHGGEIISYLNKLNPDSLKKMVVLPSPYADPESVLKVLQAYHALRERTSTEGKTIDYFNTLWNTHTLLNLKQSRGNLIESLEWQEDGGGGKSENGKTAFLVSSAPSLDEFLTDHRQELSQLASRYPLISVPGITHRLLDSGISPFAVFATDAGFANSYHFGKLWSYRKSLPLIAPLSIHPSIARHWENLIYYWDMEEHGDLLTPILGRENFIPADASVVLSALRFLSHLGCRRIFTIGVDFTMTPFREHALGNTTQEILFNTHTRLKNHTTVTHNLYHKQSFPYDNSIDTNVDNGLGAIITEKKAEEKVQNQALKLYQQQFQKIKTNFQQKGIEIAPISAIDWEKYLQDGSRLSVIPQAPTKSLSDIYHQIRERFKSQLSLSHPQHSSQHSFKKRWLLARWERV